MVKLLGELQIEINGKSYVLTPTNKALVLVEQLSGKSLSELVHAFLGLKCSFADAANILYAGLYGTNGNKADGLPSLEACQELVMQHGLSKIVGPLSQFISAAYVGKPIDEITRAREAKKPGSEKPDAGDDQKNVTAGMETSPS